MPRITTNEIELVYEQTGSGQDVILISGFSAPRQSWYPIYQQLAQHFRVTILDNRGVGQSSIPDEPYSMHMMANDVVGLMDALGMEKASVVGHSMGGFIVRALLDKHQHRLNKAVMQCSAFENNPAWRYQVMFSQKLRELDLPRSLQLESMVAFMFGHDFLNDTDKVAEFIRRSTATPKDPVGVRRQNQAIIDFYRQPPKLHIDIPLLGIFGQEDLIVPVSAAQTLRAEMPQAEVVILENCGHMAQFEQPAQLIDVLQKFLQKV